MLYLRIIILQVIILRPFVLFLAAVLWANESYVPGKVYAADVIKLDSATTVNGADVMIRTSEKGVNVNDARVIKTDIGASNGVIHIIDTVILPR